MYFYIAFDKTINTEYLLYKDIIHKDKWHYSEPVFKSKIINIGSFLLYFLNLDYSNLADIGRFISKFCYESLYYGKYGNKESTDFNFISLKLNDNDYYSNLFKYMRLEQENFIYTKNVFLKHLKLPYNKEIVDEISEEDDINYDNLLSVHPEIETFAKDWDDYFEQKADSAIEKLRKFKQAHPDLYEKYKQYHYQNSKNEEYFFNPDNTEINGLIHSLKLDFDFTLYFLCGINLNIQNIPYCFYSSSIIDILAIEFKEFTSDKHHIIKQCKNCGRYFIPENLRDIKYCNNIFKDNKTCKELGKQLSYKKSLKDDKLLDMYRKRYLSLASSVSHYGTEKAIEKFENYKKKGAVMKKKYLDKEISGKDFRKWIENTK